MIVSLVLQRGVSDKGPIQEKDNSSHSKNVQKSANTAHVKTPSVELGLGPRTEARCNLVSPVSTPATVRSGYSLLELLDGFMPTMQ